VVAVWYKVYGNYKFEKNGVNMAAAVNIFSALSFLKILKEHFAKLFGLVLQQIHYALFDISIILNEKQTLCAFTI